VTDVLRLPYRGTGLVALVYNPHNDPTRSAELENCQSVNSLRFDAVMPVLGRPTFQEMVERASWIGSRTTVVLANADIEFPPETIELLRHVDMGDHAFALSRYNPTPDGLKLQWQARGSQDCWIFQGPPKHVEADFPMGILGCDNRFAAELERAGYLVYNPCETLVTIHRHAQSTTVWTGDKDKDEKLRARARAGLPRVPRPYKLVDPCRLELT